MREKFNALLTESEENARRQRTELESKHKEDVSNLTSARMEMENSHIVSRREFENEISFFSIYVNYCPCNLEKDAGVSFVDL